MRPKRPHPTDGAKTHEWIAQQLGISKARVQQIEAAALKKLRKAARKLVAW